MRLPEKAPTIKELSELLIHFDIKSFLELKEYVDIINSKYLHWDELQMRFKDKNIDLKLLWGWTELTRESISRRIELDGLTLRYVQTPQIEKELHIAKLYIYIILNICKYCWIPRTRRKIKSCIN